MKLSQQTIRWTAFTAGCAGIGALLLLQISSVPEIALPAATPASPTEIANESQPTAPALPTTNSQIAENPETAPTILRHPDAHILANQSLSLDERARAALRLAQAAPDGARDELLRVIENPDEAPFLRAAAAQALAQLDDRESRALAEKLAHGNDANLARGAIRGLASHDNPANVDFLANLLNNQSSPEAVRMEAALGLAKMNSPAAYEALLQATHAELDTHASEPVFHDVLRGLVRGHYNRSGGLIDNYLNHPEIDSGTKVVAIDEMAGLSGNEALAALLVQAQSEDPAVREAAAWAIASHNDASLARDYLLEFVEKEQHPWVRTGFYEALRHQESIDITNVWDRVANEQNLSARLSGIKLIADHLSPTSKERFSNDFVPQLQEIATNDPSLTNRLDAIIALGRARDVESATNVLRQIQKSDNAELQRAAQLALR